MNDADLRWNGNFNIAANNFPHNECTDLCWNGNCNIIANNFPRHSVCCEHLR